MEKMMDTNLIDYCIIDCTIPSTIAIKNRFQINFNNPEGNQGVFVHNKGVRTLCYNQVKTNLNLYNNSLAKPRRVVKIQVL